MKINKCRACESKDLVKCLDLGNQYLTGIFPINKNQKVSTGNLSLVFCKKCSLLQLSENFNRFEMYGSNYGYMSSLNQSMVSHLKNKAEKIKKLAKFSKSDLFIDIGSNDGTFLSFFLNTCKTVGVDPTIKKFKKFYKKKTIIIPDFFSSKIVKKNLIKKKAKAITSIAMFYDLENPISFAREIYETLDEDGIWHFEQSYMPSMIKNISYDTICHEHLEYYSLKSLKYILDKSNFKIIEIELNDINGGSFAITVAKKNSKKYRESSLVDWLLKKEELYKFNKIETLIDFKNKVFKHKKLLKDLILNLKDMKKNIAGYGASTKGNVILQFCNLNSKSIPYIVDVNPYKRNRVTPGTKIRIINDSDFKKKKPDYLLVLPWHFKNHILQKEHSFIKHGGHFIFPLPDIEIV
tara:strand:- start:2505 stop:3728 length:1224 start_codon:yes stop_codon:yes gene_type:complete